MFMYQLVNWVDSIWTLGEPLAKFGRQLLIGNFGFLIKHLLREKDVVGRRAYHNLKPVVDVYDFLINMKFIYVAPCPWSKIKGQ